MGRGERKWEDKRNETTRTATEHRGGLNGGNFARKSAFTPKAHPFDLLVFPYDITSDQYQAFRRFRNAGYWSDGR